MRVSILAIVFLFIFDAATASLVLHQKRVNEPVSTHFYNCGPMVYLESTLQMAAINRLWASPDGPKPYRGLLYDMSLQYKIVRITERMIQRVEGIPYRFDAFYMVIDGTNRLIDVLAKMSNGQFIKCERVDMSMPEPQYTGPVEECIHECGPEIFTYETLQMSVNKVISQNDINIKYPIPYYGDLYPPELWYMIYPVLSEIKEYQSTSTTKFTYFVVVTPTGEIVDMIAELTGGDYIKCARKPRGFDPVDDGLRSGYLCGTVFFESAYLEHNAYIAKVENSKLRYSTFPRLYSDANFVEPLWSYPIFPNGKLWGKGKHTLKHFLLMDSSFRIALVVIKTIHGTQRCEKVLRSHDSSLPKIHDYKCFNVQRIFRHKDVMNAVDNGCQFLGTMTTKYPAEYRGPDFDIAGPYFTWPLLRGGIIYTTKAGSFRVVFNPACEVAGVISLYKRSFLKCVRMGDGTTPSLEQNTPITEVHWISDRGIRI